MIPRRPLLLAGVLLLLAACSGSTGVDEPLASAAEATPPPTLAIPSDLPSVQAVPETDKPSAAEEPAVTQTDTEWGRIWDALPASFPVYPGAVETEEAGGGEPVSATFSSAAAADELATWMQSRLELATYSTEALSGPLEDGSFVLDSVGDGGLPHRDDRRACWGPHDHHRPLRCGLPVRIGREMDPARPFCGARTQHIEPNRRPYC